MGRIFDLPALIRVLMGADQGSVQLAVDYWMRRQPVPNFDFFIYTLRLLSIVVDRIPWVRQVGVLTFFLDLLDLVIDIYTFPGTIPQLPPPPGMIEKVGLLRPDHVRRLQAILESLRAI